MTVNTSDVATLRTLETQVKELREAIKAAVPAAERLAKADEDNSSLVYDMLTDALADDPVNMGSVAGILYAIDNCAAMVAVA